MMVGWEGRVLYGWQAGNHTITTTHSLPASQFLLLVAALSHSHHNLVQVCLKGHLAIKLRRLSPLIPAAGHCRVKARWWWWGERVERAVAGVRCRWQMWGHHDASSPPPAPCPLASVSHSYQLPKTAGSDVLLWAGHWSCNTRYIHLTPLTAGLFYGWPQCTHFLPAALHLHASCTHLVPMTLHLSWHFSVHTLHHLRTAFSSELL